MKYLLGIDFGGSSAKATLIDIFGTIAAEASAEYPTYYPHSGFCEQSADDWCAALVSVIRGILDHGIDAHDILALAVDSATHTFLLTDGNFKPLCNAVHWTDSRAKSESAYLRERFGDEIFASTYHKPDTIWTMPQLLWMKNNVPAVLGAAKHLFFEKDYLRFFLTGVYGTDHIDAEGSMLYDMNTHTWSDTLCSMIGLDKSILPPCEASDKIIGTVTDAAASLTGLVSGTPVLCGTTDTVMEVFAAGAVKKGDMTVKLATAGRICVITDRPYPDRDLVNYTHIVPELWYPGAATKAAASSLRWYRTTFGGSYSEIDAAAASVTPGADGLFFHPYINGELTPYADPSLCGSFVGVRSMHTKAHFDRAVLEGVAFSLLHSLHKIDELGLPHVGRATLIGGGAKSELWGQIVADTLGLTLDVTVSSDSSLGSAMLAGLAAGVFSSPSDAVEKCVRVKKTITPNDENTARYRTLFDEYVRIHDALAPIYAARNA